MLQTDTETHRTKFLDFLPPAEGEALKRASELLAFPAGSTVFQQGERLPGIFVVASGCLKLVRSTGKDKIQVLDIVRPGRCVGDVHAITGSPTIASAAASVDSECWLVPKAELGAAFKKDPVLQGAMLMHMAMRLGHMVPLIETLSLHTVPERVAKLILDFHGQEPTKSFVEFYDTQEGLAQFVGSSREAFNRALKMLSDLGFIHNTFPVVHITDEEKLQKFAEGF